MTVSTTTKGPTIVGVFDDRREECLDGKNRVVVHEEIELANTMCNYTQHVSDSVRRDGTRVENESDENTAHAGGASWSQAMPDYRQRWLARSGTGGNRLEDPEPGRRQGL